MGKKAKPKEDDNKPQLPRGALLERLVVDDLSYGHPRAEIARKYDIAYATVQNIEAKNRENIIRQQDKIVAVNRQSLEEFGAFLAEHYMDLARDVVLDLKDELAKTRALGNEFDPYLKVQRVVKDDKSEIRYLRKPYDLKERIALFERIVVPILKARNTGGAQ